MILALLFALFLIGFALYLFFRVFGFVFLKLLLIGLSLTIGSVLLILLIFGIIIL